MMLHWICILAISSRYVTNQKHTICECNIHIFDVFLSFCVVCSECLILCNTLKGIKPSNKSFISDIIICSIFSKNVKHHDLLVWEFVLLTQQLIEMMRGFTILKNFVEYLSSMPDMEKFFDTNSLFQFASE